MKKQIALILIVLSVVVTGFTMEAIGQRAESSESAKESLKGITILTVLIDDLKPEFEKDAFTKSTIQTDVELKLRMAGIKVVSEATNDNIWMEEGYPFLYINISTGKYSYGSGKYSYVYNISVELRQMVRLYRNGILLSSATTWSTRSFGYVGIMQTPLIRDRVKDHVDEFVNDYLEMNPKE